MAEIVNLKREKKRRQRQSDSDKAAENRAIYGEARLAKQLRRALERKAKEEHAGHLREVTKNPIKESE